MNRGRGACALFLLVLLTGAAAGFDSTPSALGATRGPDLLVGSVSGSPSTVPPGGRLTGSDSIRNSGRRAAGVSMVAYHLSSDRSKSGSDPFVGFRRSGRHPGRRVRSGRASLLIPPDTADGFYFLIACADALRQVREPREKNNCRASGSPIRVLALAPPAANDPPVPGFGFSPSDPIVDEEISFSSTSSDPDGTIVATAWDLDNDGEFDDAAGTGVSHSFPSDGTKVVRIRVTDDDGASGIAVREVGVDPDPDFDGDGSIGQADCEPYDPNAYYGAPDPLNPPGDTGVVDTDCDAGRFDGVVGDAIWVSGELGVDSSSNGLTPFQPVATIGYALTRAAATNRNQVRVFSDHIYDEPLTLANGKSILGGWSYASSRRDGSLTTIINQTTSPGNVIGLSAIGLTQDTTVSNFRILTGSASGAGSSAIAVYARDSSKLILESVRLQPGNGAPGSPGNSGAAGLTGTNGSAASGCQNNGYLGGARTVSGSSISGGNGGRGGNYSLSTHGNGLAGSGGFAGGGAATAGSGGAPGAEVHLSGGVQYLTTEPNGTDGGDGANGANGSNGAGGTGGTITAFFWSSSGGATGNAGQHGGGGGGGGGGGQIIDDAQPSGWQTANLGDGGGGGGAGGAGGGPGFGGTGGGGSFGMLVVNTSSSPGPALSNVTISRGTGGTGGTGGVGGIAGAGGSGGAGGTACAGYDGGDGGEGGDAGNGGHGGGGAGGPSYGIYASEVSPAISTTGVQFIASGGGGPGGPGAGNPGQAGTAANKNF